MWARRACPNIEKLKQVRAYNMATSGLTSTRATLLEGSPPITIVIRVGGIQMNVGPLQAHL